VLLTRMSRRPNAPVLPLTWGAPDAFTTEKHDAVVAKRVCERLNLPFTYLEERTGWDDPERCFAQFVAYGEGMVDHLHMQSLRPPIAEWCATRGASIMVRGDEAFGWRAVRTEAQCRHGNDLVTAAELREGWPELRAYWKAQTVPSVMERRADETVPGYRDRLYREVRCPAVLAGLNGGYARHLEVVNPFLDRRLVTAFARLDDAARTNKRAFQRYVDRVLPDIPFAEFAAISETRDLLRRPAVRAFLGDRLGSEDLRDLFGAAVCERLQRGLAGAATGAPRRGRGALAESAIRLAGKERLRGLLTLLPSRPQVSAERMALRLVTVAELHADLRRIARAAPPVG